MRLVLLACAVLSCGLGASELGARSRSKLQRTAQVIMMEPRAEESSPSGERVKTSIDPDNEADGQGMGLDPIPAAFRTHDLSRRWVAFEMANSFAAANRAQSDNDDADPFARVGVASLGAMRATPLPPAIAIPTWMQEGVAFSSVPTSFAPGCNPSSYRPAGFLDARTEFRRSGYYGMMSSIACEYGLPVGLFDAMIIRESGYDAGIYSPKNAFGLTQLMAGTAAGLGVNRYDVEQNLRGGARYLRQQLDHFGQIHLALAAYNAGPGRVRNGLVPRIAQTQDYVDNVLLNWRRLAGMPARTAVQDQRTIPDAPPTRNGRLATVYSY